MKVLRTTAGTSLRALGRQGDRGHQQRMRAVRAGLELPPLPRSGRRHGEVWAVSMVRDEVDILPSVVAHLERQGIDRILIADNGSVDGTTEFLRQAFAQGRVLLALDHERAYYQAEKMTLLARAAGRAGADWIIPFDADEMWFADQGLLAERIRALDADVVHGRLFNAFPTATGGWAVDVHDQLHGKVAFRAHPLAYLTQGNHTVDRPGTRSPLQLPVAHFPWRSLDQFERKVRQGAAAYAAATSAGTEGHLGSHWRHLATLSSARLEELWQGLMAGEAVAGMHWQPQGALIEADPTAWLTWDPDQRLSVN